MIVPRQMVPVAGGGHYGVKAWDAPSALSLEGFRQGIHKSYERSGDEMTNNPYVMWSVPVESAPVTPTEQEAGAGLVLDDPQAEIRREAALGFGRALVEGTGETDPEAVARLAVEMADALQRLLQAPPK